MVLDWSLSETEEELLCDMEQVQGILNTLEPPSQIKDMQIIGYQRFLFATVDDGTK